MEASDNGFVGAGGIRTASIAIQVAVVAVNDAPVVVAPSEGKAVPGEMTPFPGFLIMDPDTDMDGMMMAGMLKVMILRQRLIFATMHATLRASRRYWAGRVGGSEQHRVYCRYLANGASAVESPPHLMAVSTLDLCDLTQTTLDRYWVFLLHLRGTGYSSRVV